MNDNTSIKNQKPWLAALFSIYSGLGQVYTGHLRRGIVLNVTLFTTSLTSIYYLAKMGYFTKFSSVLPYFLIYIFYKIFIMRDAFKLAKKNISPPKSKIRYVYFILYALATVGLYEYSNIAGTIKKNYVETFFIPALTMEPIVKKSTYALVDKNPKIIAPGDIITLAFPYETAPQEFSKYKGKMFIKRLVALEGDTVRISPEGLYINHQLLSRNQVKRGKDIITLKETNHLGRFYNVQQFTDASYTSQYYPSSQPDADITVPKGFVFVLGDNRNKSIDSRYFGFVPIQNITGKLSDILFKGDNFVSSLKESEITTQQREQINSFIHQWRQYKSI